MTLTTVRLKWLHDAATELSATKLKMTMRPNELLVLTSELLANREAQPVLYASEETLAYAKEGEKSLVTWSDPMGDAVIPLYTAPPAPANARAVAWEVRYWNSGHNMWHDWERITAEQHAEMSVQHAADNDYEFRVLYDAPPAPAVPDGWIACSERMPEPNKYVQVSNGVWVGIGMFNDADHFEDDERWQDEHHEFIDLLHHPVTHWMPLPAAPEGGNG
ncbi:DUF551 domain-containing protein [Serratia marcescens]|uniref:DUF551 domain-containing protein n=1 Tax=Serratia marcescens TaxID=615 RepID=UPI001D02FE82|nr:DUF551 domain-containing protein [Serratia marcescens]